MTTKSVRTYPNAAIDALAENSVTPHDIVCQLEEAFARNFIKPQPLIQLLPHVPLDELVANDPMMGTMAEEMTKFAESRQLADARWQQKLMIYRNFGRYGLEKDEIALIERAKDGLDSVEDRLAAACYAVEAVKSRKAWKLEQSKHQNPSNYADLAVAKKVKVGNKNEWVDSVIHELPPATKGKAHAEAYYAMKLPDGRIVNLGASQGSFAPILNKYPSRALRNIATRLEITPEGGDTAVLNQILDAPLIEWKNDKDEVEMCYKWLPSYTSAWQGNVWLIYVGWRLNPKCNPSSYWVDANSELTQSDPNIGIPIGHESYQAPLSLSQLDYHLLRESSDLAVENEDGEVVDFMNEEEEFLTCFPKREDETDFIDRSKYCEDDPEMELINAASGVVQRSEAGITLGDLQSKEFVDEYLHQGIEDAKATIERCLKQEPSELGKKIIGWMQEKIARLMHLTNLHEALIQSVDTNTDQIIRHWYPHHYVELKGCSPTPQSKQADSYHGENTWKDVGREYAFMSKVDKMPVVIPNAHRSPDGDIEQQKVTRHEFKQWPTRTFQMNLKQAKQLRRQKQVAQSIIHNRFGMLIREKAAANVFASTLDELLS